jgi:4-amino-4-deoxy-L-arabinose transferase-like glycosyltransferase
MRRYLPGLLLPLVVYFILALPQLDLPGLHNDEAAEAGLQAGQIISGQAISAFRDTGIVLEGRTFPLMVQDYIGAFNVYFSLPFLATFGSTVFALRLYTVLVGAVTILFTFGFVREAFGLRPAFIAAMLLAASPSFIFWQRQGVFVASLTATLTMATLWVGALWAKKGGWKLAALLGLLCGAGLYAKLLFIWVVGGAIGALTVINTPIIIRHLAAKPQLPKSQNPNLQSLTSNLQLFPRTPTLPHLIAFTLGLLVGILPLIAYNLQTGGTLFSVGANLTTSYYGVNNLNFAENLRGRIDQFGAVLAGRDHLWYLGGSFGNAMWETALRVAALAIVARALFRRQRSRAPLALLLLLAFGVIQTSFTVSGLFPTHFSIFAPLWPVIVAVACEIIFNPFYEPIMIHVSGPPLSALGGLVGGWLGFVNIAMVVLAIGLGMLWAQDVFVVAQYHAALNKSGGLGPHSDAVYRLTDYLEENGDGPVAAMDWGFAPQVRMLTGDKVAPQEIFGYTWETDEGFAGRLDEFAAQPGALFVFHFPQETIFPRREAFDAYVQSQGWGAEQVAIISRRDGAPVFEVVRVRR